MNAPRRRIVSATKAMKSSIIKLAWILPVIGLQLTISSCTTDTYGNTAVTPVGATAIGVGALAAGVAVGAAINNDRDDHHHHHHYNPPPRPRPHYHGHHRPSRPIYHPAYRPSRPWR